MEKEEEKRIMLLNKIYCVDCLKGLKLVGEKSVDLIIIDPPYNIKKDSWDDVKNYEIWLKEVILELQRVLKENGSFYMFHSEMEILADFIQWFRLKTNFVFRQFIVWNKRFRGSSKKGFLDGYVCVNVLRNYQQMAEYILFYTFQDETGLSKIMGNCVYPVRDYIRSEIKKAKGKIVLKEINKVLGTATSGGGIASAYLSLEKNSPSMITEEHYFILRNWLNEDLGKEYSYLRKEYEDLRKEYSYLRKEYSYLRKEYEDLRYTFNNKKTHHSVWNYDIESKQGHLTPKPLELIKNIIRHSSKKGDIVLDCFMGSGTTAVACQQLGRNFIGFETEQTYVRIAEKRLSQKTLLKQG
jgi:DNA modification methylase